MTINIHEGHHACQLELEPFKLAIHVHARGFIRTHARTITTTMTMTIPPLPEELIVLILEDFALPGSGPDDGFSPWYKATGRRQRECMKTLSSSCLVSKSLYRLAWPVLYRSFNNYELFWGMRRTERLDSSLFLKTICTNPEYGLAVRSLSIESWESVEAMHPRELLKLLQGDATLAALFQWKTRGFWLDGEDAFSEMSGDPSPSDSLSAALCRSLEMGLPQAHMAVLLLLCPRIEELNITTPSHFATSMIARLLDTVLSESYRKGTPPSLVYDPEQDHFDHAVAQMFGIPSYAPSLQKSSMLQDLVRCTIRGSGAMPSGLKFFKKLISLPSLRDVSVTGLQGCYHGAMDDLDSGVVCPQLRKLHLVRCRLRTNEASSVIKCCPNLSDLAIIWSDISCIVHELPSDEDWRLKFGEIGDAILKFTPNLEFLNLQADQWPHRHFSSDYPYTIGESLRQLDYLTSLSLNYDMIYGATDPEELDIDHYTAHSDKPGVSHSTIGRIVPKGITTLVVGPQEYTNDEVVGDAPIAPWQEWQVDDLNYLMQDTSFERLCVVKIALDDNVTGDRISHEETVTKYGWESSVDRMGEYCVLVNTRRSGVDSMQAELDNL
jgi:hypothetical protein